MMIDTNALQVCIFQSGENSRLSRILCTSEPPLLQGEPPSHNVSDLVEPHMATVLFLVPEHHVPLFPKLIQTSLDGIHDAIRIPFFHTPGVAVDKSCGGIGGDRGWFCPIQNTFHVCVIINDTSCGVKTTAVGMRTMDNHKRLISRCFPGFLILCMKKAFPQFLITGKLFKNCFIIQHKNGLLLHTVSILCLSCLWHPPKQQRPVRIKNVSSAHSKMPPRTQKNIKEYCFRMRKKTRDMFCIFQKAAKFIPCRRFLLPKQTHPS